MSGSSLDIGKLEAAARRLGHFQGRIASSPEAYREIKCLGDAGFLEREFGQWHRQSYSLAQMTDGQSPLPESLKLMLKNGDIRLIEGKSLEYACLRSENCCIPTQIRHMLTRMDDDRDVLFRSLKALPVVLCQRDFWIENILWANGQVVLIDWDTAGWGYAGEDVASLVFDDTDPASWQEYLPVLCGAYREGLGEYGIGASLNESLVMALAMAKFGYRMARRAVCAWSAGERESALEALLTFYALWQTQASA